MLQGVLVTFLEVVQLYNLQERTNQERTNKARFHKARFRQAPAAALAPSIAMPTVPLAQARRDLSRLLDRVQLGESVVISRNGEAVARLIPERPRHGSARQWFERLQRWHRADGHR